MVVWIKLNNSNEDRSGTCGHLKKERDKLEFGLRIGVQCFNAHRQSGRREVIDSYVALFKGLPCELDSTCMAK